MLISRRLSKLSHLSLRTLENTVVLKTNFHKTSYLKDSDQNVSDYVLEKANNSQLAQEIKAVVKGVSKKVIFRCFFIYVRTAIGFTAIPVMTAIGGAAFLGPFGFLPVVATLGSVFAFNSYGQFRGSCNSTSYFINTTGLLNPIWTLIFSQRLVHFSVDKLLQMLNAQVQKMSGPLKLVFKLLMWQVFPNIDLEKVMKETSGSDKSPQALNKILNQLVIARINEIRDKLWPLLLFILGLQLLAFEKGNKEKKEENQS